MQIQETNNEADKTEAEQARITERSLKRFIEYLKAQREIYEEAAILGKVKFIFDNKQHNEARKELFDAKTHAIESAKSDKFWGRLQTGATVATVAITITIVALSVIPTAGLSLAAIPAMALPTLSVLQPVSTAAQGATSMMKGMTNQALRQQQAHVTINAHREMFLRQYKLPQDLKTINKGATQSLDIVTQFLKPIENHRHQTARLFTNSAAPAA